MMALSNSTHVDEAWDSHELSMVTQSVQASTDTDNTLVNEWEDTALTDDGDDTMDTSGYTTAEDESEDDANSVHSCREADTADEPTLSPDPSSWSALGVASLLTLVLLATCGYAMTAMGHSLLVSSPALPIATIFLALAVLTTVESLWATVLMLNDDVWHVACGSIGLHIYLRVGLDSWPCICGSLSVPGIGGPHHEVGS